MSKALLWKDLELLKDTILAAIALLILSYVAAGVLVFTGSAGEFSWSKVVAGGASLARFTSILICALIGGHISGREREDGSNEFLAQLPISPKSVMLSKLAVSAGIFALVWIVSMTMLLLGLSGMGNGIGTSLRVLEAMTGFLASGILAFGGAWFASFFVPSAVGASFVGLMVLAPAYALQAVLIWRFELDNSTLYQELATSLMAMLGVAGIAGSFALYARRTTGPDTPEYSFLNSSVSRLPRKSGHNAEGYSTRPLSTLGALLWKDFQLIKAPLTLGLIVLAAPHAFGFAAWGLLSSVPEYFRGASLVSIAMSAVVFTFWAGQIMSMEHSAKTIKFSSYLPIPRHDAILSKLLVAFIPASAAIALNTMTLILANNSIPSSAQFGREFRWDDWNQNGFIVMGLALANGTFVSFTISWLLGAYYRRPALAIVTGIVAVPFCVMVWASASAAFSVQGDHVSPLEFAVAFSACSAVVGVAAISGGMALEYKTSLD